MPPRLVHILPANRWSGVERYALDLCRHFSGLGWRVDVFTRDARAIDSLFRIPGVRLRHARFGGWTDLTSLFQLWRFIRRHAKGEGGMVIHAHRYRDALTADLARRLARRRGVRIVMTRHYVAPGNPKMPFKALYPRLDEHLFVSERAKKTFLEAWRSGHTPFDPAVLRVVHNSLLLPDGFTPASMPDRVAAIAMYHGRLAPGKGLEQLIEAMEILARDKVKVRLRIVGTGSPDYVDGLRRRAAMLGVMDRIDWTRHTPSVMELIATADFGVLPSEVSEAFGLANVEYMVEGRPQVCTANGAQAEYLRNGEDALFVEPGNAGQLAEKMRMLAEDRDLRLKMGEAAGRNFRDSLAWPIFAEKMKEIYLG